jgi:hypothetical protein
MMAVIPMFILHRRSSSSRYLDTFRVSTYLPVAKKLLGAVALNPLREIMKVFL